MRSLIGFQVSRRSDLELKLDGPGDPPPLEPLGHCGYGLAELRRQGGLGLRAEMLFHLLWRHGAGQKSRFP
jgi:hypothetical protein